MTDSFVVAIPARLGSTRLPRKPLQCVAGRPLVAYAVATAQRSGARQVVVATDSSEIADAVRDPGVTVCMTRADHLSGTDRIAEAAQQLGWDEDTVVVNVQADEPLLPASAIAAVARSLLRAGDCSMATLAVALDDVRELFDPNCVKLVCDARARALYFSRAAIPWARDAFAADRGRLPDHVPFLRHIGIYAYRAGFLKEYVALPPSRLERVEALEQLRALEYGHAIAVQVLAERFPAGVDTPEDLHRVEALLSKGCR